MIFRKSKTIFTHFQKNFIFDCIIYQEKAEDKGVNEQRKGGNSGEELTGETKYGILFHEIIFISRWF